GRAGRVEDPIPGAAALGASDGTSPGVWFLELDNDEQDGLSGRHAFGAGGLDGDLAALGAAAVPLSETLVPLALDPLTVVDDDGYTDRPASSVDMSDQAKPGGRGGAKAGGAQAPGARPPPGARPAPRGRGRAGGAPAGPGGRGAQGGGRRHGPAGPAGRLPRRGGRRHAHPGRP